MSTTQKRAAPTTGAARKKPAIAAVAVAAPTNPFQGVARESRTVLRFQINPTHVTYANTLRRAMMTEVESVAFRADMTDTGSTSDVKVMQNSTPMSNEMLAHRIGLVPIHVEKPLEWNPDDYTFTLDVKNDTPNLMDITASQIVVKKNKGPEEEPELIPNTKFFYPDPTTGDTTLLTVLKGQIGTQTPEAIQFMARATLGTGRENARFMPVTSRCTYGYTLDKRPEEVEKYFATWIKSHKNMDITEVDGNETLKAELRREFNTMQVQRCYLRDERGEPYSFDFVVESVGVLDPVYIVRRAIEILQEKLLYYAAIDTGTLPTNLKVRPCDARMKGFDFFFKQEDHTLGNLLQTWMEQNMMDATKEISFVGYKVPHPLRDEMVLRVGVEDGLETTARAAVAKAARSAAQLFRDWTGFWEASVAAL